MARALLPGGASRGGARGRAYSVGNSPIPRCRRAPTVRGVTDRLFALERYDAPGQEPDSLPALRGARLVAAVHLPADQVMLALVEGRDERSVADAATAAGWRVDRMHPATWIAERGHR